MRSTLLNSNPFLQDPALRRATLRISAASSSAVEGIRKPFAVSASAQHGDTQRVSPARKSRRAAALAGGTPNAKSQPVRG